MYITEREKKKICLVVAFGTIMLASLGEITTMKVNTLFPYISLLVSMFGLAAIAFDFEE